MEKYQDMRHLYYKRMGDRQKLQQLLEDRYKSDAAIHIPFSIGEYPAFVMLNRDLSMLISSIYQANRKLERLSNSLPEHACLQFWRNMMVEEIQQSNEVENVRSTRKEIREAVQEIELPHSTKRFRGMVKKYDMLIRDKEIPLRTCSDIRKLYDEFVLDEILRENPDNVPDGLFFRQSGVSVYSGHDQEIHRGIVPEQAIIETMEQALAFLNNDNIDPLIRIAVFHYAFSYIHPFYDGNGRMTRFISACVLSQYFDKSACLRIAYIIKAQRPLYYRIFKDANNKHSMGELTSFVMQFLSFFLQALDNSYSILLEKRDHLHRYKALLAVAIKEHPTSISTKGKVLLEIMLQEELFGFPRYDINYLSSLLDVSEKTARKTMEEYEPLVYHVTEKRKHFWYINLQLLEKIDAPE